MDSFSDSENDSDKELQAAFSKGTIRGKLVGEAVEKKLPSINNLVALRATLDSIKSTLPWIERMDVTADPVSAPAPLRDQLGENAEDLAGDQVHNDFKREYKFHRQAQAAVLQGLQMLHRLGVPTRRPNDNFAEMVKSDVHMKKVREKLLTEQLRMDRSEKVKKLRDLRKYGKKVQQEVKMKRQKEKKDMTDAIKRFRKGQDKSLDVLETKKPGSGKKPVFEPNKRRQMKNQKFGFGGQKKRSKSNNSASVDQVSFPSHKKDFKRTDKNPGNRGGNKGGNKNKGRPGKNKRQKMKSKGK